MVAVGLINGGKLCWIRGDKRGIAGFLGGR